MRYNPFHSVWKNKPDPSTPVTAEALMHIEKGVAGAYDLLGASGFAPYRPGVRSRVSCTELGLVQATSAAPAGEKATVLAESWGSPGVINHIWTANTGADASIDSFIETGGRLRVFADNSKTPVVDLTLSEFFGYVGRAGIYATPRVGRTARDTDRSSAYRYVDIPFAEYMRVEVVNTTAVQANAFYGMVSYTLGDEAGALKSYSIQSKRVEANKFDRITVADFQGAGQIESLFLAFEGESDGDYGAMEGNVEIYLDGETSPSWRSPGGEDAFNGGWYLVPVGGFPAGRAGQSDIAGKLSTQWYRFFTDDPIYFTNGARVVVSNGQRGQGAIASPKVRVSAHVGAWSTTATPLSAPVIGDRILTETFDGNLSGWSTGPDRAAATVSGGVVHLPHGTTDPYRDIRHGKQVDADSYFITGRVRITNPTADDQQVFILAQGAPDPFFGSAIHVNMVRESQYKWVIRVQDDFATVGATQIDGGRDLTNVWVQLGLRVVKGEATAYWRFDGDTKWTPIVRWASSKSEKTAGFGSWTAGAEVDSFTIDSVTPPA